MGVAYFVQALGQACHAMKFDELIKDTGARSPEWRVGNRNSTMTTITALQRTRRASFSWGRWLEPSPHSRHSLWCVRACEANTTGLASIHAKNRTALNRRRPSIASTVCTGPVW